MTRWQQFLFHQLNRWQPTERLTFGALALLVGLTSGIGVWFFKQMIEAAHWLAFEQVDGWLHPLGGWTVAVLPVLGGLLVGVIKHYWIGEERHHGVAGIMEAVALSGGRLRYPRLPGKALAASISIGSGASVGPEDPSVQIGSNLGSMFGQLLRLSDERVRVLVAAGAAGGVAAAFNAPIAGVFFALEIILGEFGGSAFSVVVLAAVVSAAFTQAVSGVQPAFVIPAYTFNSIWELPLYVGLGLLAGPLSALYVHLIYRLHDLSHHLPVPGWLKPALVGLIVGVVGIFLPQVFGVGYETIGLVLQGGAMVWSFLLLLLVAKLILTPLCLAGGFQGGTFAPALFVGAMLGGAYGLIMGQLFPTLGLAPGAYAMVGMAAMLAGAVHAPLTALLLLFEMTHDYRIILPLMLAVGVSLLISQRIQRDSVYALGLARKGIRLERGRDVEVLEGVTVSEVMSTDLVTVRESDTLTHAQELFLKTRRHGLPVVDLNEELVGILTVQDIDQIIDANQSASAGEACTREVLTAYPDETLGTALRRMSVSDIGRLPVVARANPRQLVGVLRRTDLVRAYDAALTRRAELRHRAQQVRLGALGGVGVNEAVIAANATCAGKMLKDAGLPRDCVVALVRRGRQTLLPRGDTLLLAGDVLVFVADEKVSAQIQKLCTSSSETTSP